MAAFLIVLGTGSRNSTFAASVEWFPAEVDGATILCSCARGKLVLLLETPIVHMIDLEPRHRDGSSKIVSEAHHVPVKPFSDGVVEQLSEC
ncbi:hypothetical protein AS156_03475 [Bradyrhizobium macuxiense]|uniref:Uncharacterized protein n=1 Tax=Bradyrhizobium macuxiense TaxID=1755647 RepID=A0A109JXQ1_9BRAD|nr:hypothetical protein AS156_03475 [Bradyrhizobium macuxiense]